MPYTVRQVAQMAGVTVKTLHHYHKLGLLAPLAVGENGYRYYGNDELRRLQQILFYRELDFPLTAIKSALDAQGDRTAHLRTQRQLLTARRQHLDRVIETLDRTLHHELKGEPMDDDKLFTALNKDGWDAALAGQNTHLKTTYDYALPADFDPEDMNRRAEEAARFMADMASALREGKPAGAPAVRCLLEDHLRFLGLSPGDFLGQCRFFLDDDFHRSMLEGQQTGLSYYLCIAAEQLAGTPSAQ